MRMLRGFVKSGKPVVPLLHSGPKAALYAADIWHGPLSQARQGFGV